MFGHTWIYTSLAEVQISNCLFHNGSIYSNPALRNLRSSLWDGAAAYCLLLPGKTLSLTPLFNAKKFHPSGNKEGAVNAFRRLAAEGLGEVEKVKGKRGTKIVSQVVIMFNSHSCMSANRI